MQRVAAALGESPNAAAIETAFRSREQAIADSAISEATRQCETFFRNRDKAAVDTLIHRVDSMAEFASPELKSNWQNQLKRMHKRGLLGRIGV